MAHRESSCSCRRDTAAGGGPRSRAARPVRLFGHGASRRLPAAAGQTRTQVIILIVVCLLIVVVSVGGYILWDQLYNNPEKRQEMRLLDSCEERLAKAEELVRADELRQAVDILAGLHKTLEDLPQSKRREDMLRRWNVAAQAISGKAIERREPDLIGTLLISDMGNAELETAHELAYRRWAEDLVQEYATERVLSGLSWITLPDCATRPIDHAAISELDEFWLNVARRIPEEGSVADLDTSDQRRARFRRMRYWTWLQEWMRAHRDDADQDAVYCPSSHGPLLIGNIAYLKAGTIAEALGRGIPRRYDFMSGVIELSIGEVYALACHAREEFTVLRVDGFEGGDGAGTKVRITALGPRPFLESTTPGTRVFTPIFFDTEDKMMRTFERISGVRRKPLQKRATPSSP